MREPIHVTVAAIIREADRFLVVEETIDGQRRFNQPAGHLEPGESLVEAVRREVAEETTRDFEPEHLVGVHEWDNAAGEHFVRFTFAGRVSPPRPGRERDAEILANHWFDRETLERSRAEHRSPMVLRTVDDFLDGRRYPLELLNHLTP